jgi:hypothetical protein
LDEEGASTVEPFFLHGALRFGKNRTSVHNETKLAEYGHKRSVNRCSRRSEASQQVPARVWQDIGLCVGESSGDLVGSITAMLSFFT